MSRNLEPESLILNPDCTVTEVTPPLLSTQDGNGNGNREVQNQTQTQTQNQNQSQRRNGSEEIPSLIEKFLNTKIKGSELTINPDSQEDLNNTQPYIDDDDTEEDELEILINHFFILCEGYMLINETEEKSELTGQSHMRMLKTLLGSISTITEKPIKKALVIILQKIVDTIS